MATAPLSGFRSPPVSTVVCSASSRSNHRKGGGSSSNNWWTPLFGWSSFDPDYIVNQGSSNGDPGRYDKETGGQPTRSNKFGVGCFTEEKAKELRKKTLENSTFHDIMYHSAIASRLASDVYGRQGS